MKKLIGFIAITVIAGCGTPTGTPASLSGYLGTWYERNQTSNPYTLDFSSATTCSISNESQTWNSTSVITEIVKDTVYDDVPSSFLGKTRIQIGWASGGYPPNAYLVLYLSNDSLLGQPSTPDAPSTMIFTR